MWKSLIKLFAAGSLSAACLLNWMPPTQAAALDPAPPPTPASTPAPTVSSPEHPLTYSSDWAELQPGEWHWYTFKYDFDDSGDRGDSNQTPAQIRLTTEPADQATLLLLNGEQVRAWEGGEKRAAGPAGPVGWRFPTR